MRNTALNQLNHHHRNWNYRGRTGKRASDVFPSAFRNCALFTGRTPEPREDAWESNNQEEDEINSTEFLTKVRSPHDLWYSFWCGHSSELFYLFEVIKSKYVPDFCISDNCDSDNDDDNDDDDDDSRNTNKYNSGNSAP